VHDLVERIRAWRAVLVLAVTILQMPAAPLTPRVEIEEDVYTFTSAENGAGPMWCSGSTCLVRAGDTVWASGLETVRDAKPLNNCRWQIFQRDARGWQLVQSDAVGRTREPSPLAVFSDGRFFLSANPTLAPGSYSGPARPEVLQFSTTNAAGACVTLRPAWSGQPEFSEHSYRTFAADGPNRELILFQNIGYTHAEWAFLDRAGRWSAQGQLKWPSGAEYAKPQPIRVCYPAVALHQRAVHFCGVSDILEPRPEWREFKKQLTGRDWDYDFRRLFYTWTPDITAAPFRSWIEIASREATGGWISPGDLWVGPDGDVHLLWTERAIDERLRAKFFPDARQTNALNYALVRDGKVVLRRTLAEAREGGPREVPSAGRFHVTADHRLFVFYFVHGQNVAGEPVSENRLMEIRPGGVPGEPVRVPFKKPFTSCFTTTVRGGSAPSAVLDLLGHRAGQAQTISYARVRLF